MKADRIDERPLDEGRGRVVATGDASLPFRLLDDGDQPVAVVDDFVRELVANGNSPATCRSYAYDLLDWFRFLRAADVSWNRATRQHVRDYVLSILASDNPQRQRSRPDTPPPGSMNATTGKPYLERGYAPATINHRLSVIRAFYDFQAELGLGPVVNPVPTRRRGEPRRNAHHSPMEPSRVGRRAPYRQKQPKGVPRSIPEAAWQELWAALDNDRDRALFSLLISSGPRVQELLDIAASRWGCSSRPRAWRSKMAVVPESCAGPRWLRRRRRPRVGTSA